jgi:putative hydrolase of the HAD superfamily
MSPAERLAGIRAVTFDFGNTLVPVDRTALRAVVTRTAEAVTAEVGLGTPAAFLEAWSEERKRQFRDALPRLREVDLAERAGRVLARLRGLTAPGVDEPWDERLVSERSTPWEIERVVAIYSDAFVAVVRVPPESGLVLRELAGRGFQVAILSNWPLASTIDRVAAAAGWLPLLSGVFVSQRIGSIKPHPAIFAHAAAALGREPGEVLHVGDDWAADVEGAAAAGWRVAYLRDRQVDTPLPTSVRGDGLEPDLELDDLAELGAHLSDPPPVDSRHGAP